MRLASNICAFLVHHVLYGIFAIRDFAMMERGDDVRTNVYPSNHYKKDSNPSTRFKIVFLLWFSCAKKLLWIFFERKFVAFAERSLFIQHCHFPKGLLRLLTQQMLLRYSFQPNLPLIKSQVIFCHCVFFFISQTFVPKKQNNFEIEGKTNETRCIPFRLYAISYEYTELLVGWFEMRWLNFIALVQNFYAFHALQLSIGP